MLKPGGESMIQMANLYGAKSLWNQARERRFREPRTLFDVRYWGPRELRDELERRVGPTKLSVDGFFTLNPQPTDLALLPTRYRAVVRTSEALRRVSDFVTPLTYVADSVYVGRGVGSRRSRRRRRGRSGWSSPRPRSRWRRSGSSSRTAGPCSTGSGAWACTATSSSC